MSEVLSCGILIVNNKNQLLMLKNTLFSHWDIPKGTQEIEKQEKPIETCIRETKEESAICFKECDLYDLGFFDNYNRTKSLWLYLAKVEHININELFCSTTFFSKEYQQEVLEVDVYSWVNLADVPSFACKSMARLFSEEIRSIIENKINSLNTASYSLKSRL